MAQYIDPGYLVCYLNNNGKFVYSALKADDHAEPWLDYGNYLIPAAFIWSL